MKRMQTNCRRNETPDQSGKGDYGAAGIGGHRSFPDLIRDMDQPKPHYNSVSTIVLEVLQQATNLAYGALLDGTGKIWFSDLSFEVVDRSVATTNESGWDALPKPSNLDFSE